MKHKLTIGAVTLAAALAAVPAMAQTSTTLSITTAPATDNVGNTTNTDPTTPV